MGINDRTETGNLPETRRFASTARNQAPSFRSLRRGRGESRIDGITNLDPADLGLVVQLALRAGIALMFAPTSDQGAISVTTFQGDARSRDYCASPEELGDTLLAVRALAEHRRD